MKSLQALFNGTWRTNALNVKYPSKYSKTRARFKHNPHLLYSCSIHLAMLHLLLILTKKGNMLFQEEVIKQLKELLFARCWFIPMKKKKKTAHHILTTNRVPSQWVVTSAILKQYIKRKYYSTLHLNFNIKTVKVERVFKFKVKKVQQFYSELPSKSSP